MVRLSQDVAIVDEDGLNYVVIDSSGNLQTEVNNTVTVTGSVGVTGSVTVNNAAGASAVNIQDGGNSITVDGSVSARLWDGTNYVTVTGNKLDVNATVAAGYGSGNDTLNSNFDFMNIPVAGYSSLKFHITGTWSATIKVYGIQNAPQIQLLPCMNTETNQAVSQITTGGMYEVDCSGLQYVELLMTPYTSGTATVYWTASQGSPRLNFPLAVYNSSAPSLSDTQAATLQLTSAGLLKVDAAISSSSVASKTYWQQCVEAGRGFYVTTNFISISGTAETNFMLLRNASGSGKTVRIHQIHIGVRATVTGDNARIRIYRDPTVTANGSALTVRPILKSAPISAVMTAYTAPTTSALGTLLITRTLTQAWMDTMNLDETFYIQQNEIILFTIQPANTGKDHNIMIWFEEE